MKASVTAAGLGLVAVGLGVALGLKLRDNADLAAQVSRLSRQNADLHYALKQASRQATEVGQRAVELDSQLGSFKARTTATETRNQLLARELTAREQREVSLMAELAELRQRSVSSAAEQPAGVSQNSDPPPAVDVEPYRRRIAELEQQLIQLLTRSLSEVPAETPPSEEAPPSRPHQVVRVGPGDAFVVLDYGTEHGARPQAIIRLWRGTSEMAQVQISDVRPRFSIAQVLPGTVKRQLQTGDLVVFNP